MSPFICFATLLSSVVWGVNGINKEEENGRFLTCSITEQHRQDLSNQQLTRIPPDLSPSTQYLDLSNNNITRVNDKDLAALPDLCILELHHNPLEYISPTAFLNNTKLEVLNISYSLLKAIPDLSFPALRVLDVSSNLYGSYALGSSFKNMEFLFSLALGSPYATAINYTDFAPVQNIPLRHLSLGYGEGLQSYESGSFTQIPSLRKVTLIMPFCERVSMFQDILKDLQRTQVESLVLVKFLPRYCNISSDPFKGLKGLRSLKNITFVDTWFNSSVLYMFLQNLYSSPIQVTAFLNITYNEDIEELHLDCDLGKHAIKLKAIILDGILHYQMRYPKFSINVTCYSQLTYMKFSGSGMNISPCNLMSSLPSLEVLDVSNNLLTYNGFWWHGCSYTNIFPALKQLNLSKNRFKKLCFISQKTQQMRALETLDLSSNSIELEGQCSWPSHLTNLILSNNNLGNSVFSYLSPHFRSLDLSKTGISVLTKDMLSSLPNLTHLFLSSNGLQVLPADLWAPSVEVLHVDHNAISVISQDSLKGLPGLKELKAGHEPFSCKCDSYWFVTTLDKRLLPDWPSQYTCSYPPELYGMLLEEYQPGRVACEPWIQAAIAILVTLAVVLLLSLTFYACDGAWYLKMLWVWIRVKRRSSQETERLANASFHYHAFISYSQHDSNWVDKQLAPNMEKAGFSLCIHERDFVPGDWIIDNIINCVESSYKTLFVLSQSFIQSEWCNYELFFAQHRALSIQQDSLVFILLEPIPADSLPRKFMKLRTLLRQQTYLEWPKEERKQQVFWASLKRMLQEGNKHMVMKQAAVGIADLMSDLVID
ncbi:Toll-like receptor 6 [Acipenser ruthenus]|uniref:Toll-like receptor 6 n=1 Tax=Acipenser ruthenus TaxID=7906 RepID=A0A444UI84_ACIRT|nr:Toll-like receptor 6 [Acipenser ruthenus]